MFSFSLWLKRQFGALAGQRTTVKRQQRSPKKSFRPWIECLEDRLTPAPLVVSSPMDAGMNTLRAAITQANTDSDNGITDTITFNLLANQRVITPLAALPLITARNLTISGGNILNAGKEKGTSRFILGVFSLCRWIFPRLIANRGSGTTRHPGKNGGVGWGQEKYHRN